MKVFLFVLLLPLAWAITCYRGIDVKLPGAHFDQPLGSTGCRNADYCLRSFGLINGKLGSFYSCVTRENANVTCQNYPACTHTATGFGSRASIFRTCCCNTNLCNGVDFFG